MNLNCYDKEEEISIKCIKFNFICHYFGIFNGNIFQIIPRFFMSLKSKVLQTCFRDYHHFFLSGLRCNTCLLYKMHQNIRTKLVFYLLVFTLFCYIINIYIQITKLILPGTGFNTLAPLFSYNNIFFNLPSAKIIVLSEI